MIHEAIPDNEGPFQKRRRRMVAAFAVGLLLLSIVLELHERHIPVQQVSKSIRQVGLAMISPDKPLPPIDIVANVKGIAAVLRNVMPALAMFLLVLWLGARFVSAVYGLSKIQKGSDYLFTSLFGPVIGRGPSLAKLSTTLAVETIIPDAVKSRPFIIIQDAKILGDRFRPEIVVGGPATLIVYNDSALLLERAGRLTRVVGPGRHALRRFEKIRTIVDLRPRSYSLTVSGMSHEGITVNWPITVHFQINDRDQGRHEPTPSQPFAYSDSAVFKAATATWVGDPASAREMDWRDRVAVGQATGILRNIIARHPLDQLIQPDDEAADATRRSIQQELEEALRARVADQGARIRSVTLDNVELADPAAQQWVETWKARRERDRRIEVAPGEAERIQRLESVRAEAKRNMLEATIRSFQNLVGQPVHSEVVIQRFVETVRRLTTPDKMFPATLYSEQALNTLRKLVSLTYENEGRGQGPGGPAAGR